MLGFLARTTEMWQPGTLAAQPDSPEFQLDPPAVQQNGGSLVVDPCKEAEGG